MELKDFKRYIETNTLPLTFIVCECSGNGDFIFHQYLKEYRKHNHLDVDYVDRLEQSFGLDLFDSTSSIIKVYEVDTFDVTDFNPNDCVWVKCKKTSSEIKNKFSDNIVKIPKLEEWQIKDYVYSVCHYEDEKDLDSLLKIYSNNIFRLDNEIQKMLPFNNKCYNQCKSQLYTDISEFTIFDIVNSIVQRNVTELIKVYSEIVNIDIDAFGFLSLLIDNFKKVIDVQLGKNVTAESLGMSGKQFWVVQKYSCGHYNKNELLYIFKFLCNIDYMIKSGQISTNNVIDYIICKIMLI